jgi:DNA-binding NarL/FixJ family response regulator
VADVRVTSHDEALRSADRLARLKAHVLSTVVGVVGADAASIVSVTRRREVSGAIALCSPSARIAVDEAALRTALDGEDRNAGVLVLAHEAVMYLRSSGTLVAVITLLRSAGFSRADAVALRRVQPLLEHAYACAAEPGADMAFDALRDIGLTAREADVAALVGKGATNAQIARSLHLSEATVKTHLSHAYAKLGVRTRTELAVLVRDRKPRFDRTSVRPLTTFG